MASINYSKSNFEIGFWGSGDNLNYIRELDIYVSYSVKGFSLTLTDYYWNMEKGYFNYKNNTTAHVFELGLSYENENFPLQIYAGTMLYGNDRKIAYNIDETDAAKNNYSTYFELSYTFNFSQHALKIFAGATPFTGFYGTDFSVVFVGLTGSKEIEITEKFSLPVFATFAINPQTEEYFVVLGLSL